MLLVYMVVWFACLAAANEILRRLPRGVSVAFWVIVPLALLPVWLNSAKVHTWDWFLWVKTWSVIIGALWFVLSPWIIKRAPRLVEVTVWLILQVNILEAVVKDATEGHPVNAAAGVLLILSAPLWRAVRIGQAGPREAVLYASPWSWIIAYTVWNAVFAYNTLDGYPAAHHLAVVLSPVLIAAVVDRDLWLQSRAFTLGIHFMVYGTFIGWFRENFDSSHWNHSTVCAILQGISLVVVLVHVGLFVKQKLAERKARASEAA